MHTRRLTLLILGVWLGLTIAMMFVATQNFRGVDRMLESPSREAKSSLRTLGNDNARSLLRYQVAELNRFFFGCFGVAQISLALLLALSLLFATNGNKLLMSLAMLLVILVFFEQFFLLPEINYLGRMIDFVPKVTPSLARDRFSTFHIAFSAMEVVKLLLFLAVAVKMLARNESRRRVHKSSELREESFLTK